MTTKNKNTWYSYQFIFKDKLISAALHQMRLLDSKRLIKRIGNINRPDYKKLISVLMNNLFKFKLLDNSHQGAEAEDLINYIKAKAKYVLIVTGG